MLISVTKLFEFEAAHHLPNYDGACRNPHGHSYKLEVEVAGKVDEMTGMIIDFSDLKKAVKELIINEYDHTDLNKFYSMPTAENMAVRIFHVLKNSPGGIPNIVRVRLWETSTSYAEVKL